LVNGGVAALSGAITLTLPQSIATISTPQFAKLAIGSSSLIANRVMPIATGLTGGTTALGVDIYGSIASDVTASAVIVRSNSSTAAAAFTLSSLVHFQASPSTKGAGSTITTMIGFEAANSMIQGDNNYGFYGNIASGTNRWNFYANGTASNYFAGNVGYITCVSLPTAL